MTSSTTDGTDAGLPALLEVGRIAKPHGLTGEVVVNLFADFPERLAPGNVLAISGGELEVKSSRPHQGRYLVRFAGVVDRDGADRLRGVVLLAAPLEVPGTLWVHQLVACRAVAPDGSPLGTVVAVEANPASDLLVLDSGALVPLRFVTDFVPGTRVTLDVPAGLLD